ncbi:DNA alkylation repair protein [Rapidithrix thailandica]|uniref:DNA alkylation repair protein n=1 Tax=Rapidithrix thailandica TaxID=413964 RepID=A0AAW9SBB7_9BACT
MNAQHYLQPLQQAFEDNRNVENAQWASQYLKNQFAFYGVKSPERKVLFRDFYKKQGLPEKSLLEEVVRVCWQLPEREWQYVAMELLAKCKRKLSVEDLPLLEEIILQKSWWDTVDFIASDLVGYTFKKFPEERLAWTSKWISSQNIWLQRTCIIFQLKYKKDTDFSLLTSFILPLTHSKEFFIRKAIGWALREYAKYAPDEVLKFVEKTELSGLSRREALRRIQTL